MTDNSGIAFQKTLMSVIDMVQRTLWCLWHMIMIALLNRNKTSSCDINYWREKSLKQQPIMHSPFMRKNYVADMVLCKESSAAAFIIVQIWGCVYTD